MYDFVFPLAVLAGWFVLMRWVLPWLGVPTCMSGACCGDRCKTDEMKASEKH